MREPTYISSEEAVRLFIRAGLSESTFRRKIAEHPIRNILPPGRVRGHVFLLDDVKAAIQQSKKVQRKLTEIPVGTTDWIQERDLSALFNYEIKRRPDYNIALVPAWWKAGISHLGRICFDQQNRSAIWAAVAMLPLEEATVFKILRGEMPERLIERHAIQRYEPGSTSNVLLIATCLPRGRESVLRLIQEFFEFWCAQSPPVQVSKLFTRYDEEISWDVISRLFFAPRVDLGEQAFMLDFAYKNPSELISQYQQCLKQEAHQPMALT